jgi:hypothetical protein
MYQVQITNVTFEILDFTGTGGEAFSERVKWPVREIGY